MSLNGGLKRASVTGFFGRTPFFCYLASVSCVKNGPKEAWHHGLFSVHTQAKDTFLGPLFKKVKKPRKSSFSAIESGQKVVI